MEDGLDLTQGWKQVMTRETKIGLLLGMCVILLIGIIISDQLSQPQQDPADFTDFAAETQRSIEATDAAPSYTATPGIGKPDTPAGGSSPVIEPPSNFFIPNDRSTSPNAQRQADATEAQDSSPELALLNNVEEAPASRGSNDSVTTVTVGETDAELPHRTPVTYIPTPPTRTPPVTRPGTSAIRHTVQKNETLTGIAQRYYGDGDAWRVIAQANPDTVTPNGHTRQGVVLNIPKRDDVLNGSLFERAGSETTTRVTPTNNRTSAKIIEVRSGDTLSELATKHLGSAALWEDLLDANRDKLDDPTDLQVGMKLRLPGSSTTSNATVSTPTRSSQPSSNSKTYTVRPGDNLTLIAEKTLGDGNKWKLISEANKLKSPNSLEVGQKLRIPTT